LAEFVKGDVVVVPFPFSDLTQVKKRPAFVLATLSGNEVILCLITSKDISDEYSIGISENDFKSGKLSVSCQVRPNKIFTAEKAIIIYRAGTLKDAKGQEIFERIISILSQ